MIRVFGRYIPNLRFFSFLVRIYASAVVLTIEALFTGNLHRAAKPVILLKISFYIAQTVTLFKFSADLVYHFRVLVGAY